MTLRQTVELAIGPEQLKQLPSSSDLVMAWAVDLDTGQPRYILQLHAAHRGKKSNCKCPSCDLPLVAVNAAKTVFLKRPHFRHPEGAAREHCVIVAARKALSEMFSKQDQIVLPRRRRSRNIEGLSGHYYDAWVERPSESVGINECAFRDEATAILTLDDGRRLVVQLVGRGEVARLDGDETLLARIELEVDDPAIAMMSPKEIFERLELAWSNACWTQHWADADLDYQADARARESAASAFDWLDSGDSANGLSPTERRETLLHREVKAILEREKRIRLPELYIEAQLQRSNGFVDRKVWSAPEAEVSLTSVELEVHLGCSVPDVIATWIDEDGWTHSIFIEVTVTNPIGDERIDRLSSFGFPALEIDIGRMGGIVTREELTHLVVDEVAGKRWLYHPTLNEKRRHLLGVMKEEAEAADAAARMRQELLNISAVDWSQRYLTAFHQRWIEQLAAGEGSTGGVAWRKAQDTLLEAIKALEVHGYPFASMMDQHPLRTIIARIFSIRCGTGVEYKYDNAWAVINSICCDRGASSLKWHTLYLIAVRTYQPILKTEHVRNVAQWRNEVKLSIENEEAKYVRDTVYDQLLELLFPEMRSALNNPFGTPLQILEKDDDVFETLPYPQPVQFETSGNTFLHGREFEEWARRNPDAAKVWLDSPAGKKHQQQQNGHKSAGSQQYGQWKRKRS
jgi:hypothetical protein